MNLKPEERLEHQTAMQASEEIILVVAEVDRAVRHPARLEVLVPSAILAVRMFITAVAAAALVTDITESVDKAAAELERHLIKSLQMVLFMAAAAVPCAATMHGLPAAAMPEL